MRSDLLVFMRREGLWGTQSVRALIGALEDEAENELLADVQKAVEEFGLLDSQRIDSLLTLLDEDEEDEGAGDAA